MAYRFATSLDELWDGEMTGILIEGTKVVLVRIGDEVHAYHDRCAHLGVRISEGRCDGGVLTCAAHLYTYEAATGRGINPKNLALTAFPLRIESGGIWVDLP